MRSHVAFDALISHFLRVNKEMAVMMNDIDVGYRMMG